MDSGNGYNAVTPEMVETLQALLGGRNVLSGDPDALSAFSRDETPGLSPGRLPDVVVRPGSPAEVAEIMRLANLWMVPVTPRGAGSGLSGGAVPVFGGIVLSLDRMNRILEIDERNMMAVVEPGISPNDLNERLAPLGLFYAGYPMSRETCQIGGNVAENAGGGKAVKYGVTSRYVLGLQVVTPTGDLIELGGKLPKDVTGYNLLQLMVGSEGTLGIFTKIILKLLPLPRRQTDMLCLFENPRDAVDAVPGMIMGSGVTPTSIEFMDALSLRTTNAFLNESLPVENAGAALLVSVDGPDKKRLEDDCFALGAFCEERGAFEIFVGDNPTTSERLWKFRRSVPEAFAAISKLQRGEDVAVPPASIPDVVDRFAEIAEKFGVTIPCYGHAGDGNLHVRITAPEDWSEERWRNTLPDVLDAAHSFVAEIGGTLSGEHGIGLKHKNGVARFLSDEVIALSKTLKKAFDPNGILNPGKIFPK